MTDITKIGYAGKILRVDLTESKTWTEELDLPTVKNGSAESAWELNICMGRFRRGWNGLIRRTG